MADLSTGLGGLADAPLPTGDRVAHHVGVGPLGKLVGPLGGELVVPGGLVVVAELLAGVATVQVQRRVEAADADALVSDRVGVVQRHLVPAQAVVWAVLVAGEVGRGDARVVVVAALGPGL